MVPAQLIIIMISVTNTGILLVEKHALFSDTHVDLSARGFHSDSISISIIAFLRRIRL